MSSNSQGCWWITVVPVVQIDGHQSIGADIAVLVDARTQDLNRQAVPGPEQRVEHQTRAIPRRREPRVEFVHEASGGTEHDEFNEPRGGTRP